MKNNSNVPPGTNWKKSEPGDASGGPGRWRKEKAAGTPGCFVFLHNEKSGPGGAGTALNFRPAEARQVPGTAAKRELFRKSKSKIHVKSWHRIWCFAAETVKNFYKIIPLIQVRALRPAGRLSVKTGERHLGPTAWGMGRDLRSMQKFFVIFHKDAPGAPLNPKKREKCQKSPGNQLTNEDDCSTIMPNITAVGQFHILEIYSFQGVCYR